MWFAVCTVALVLASTATSATAATGATETHKQALVSADNEFRLANASSIAPYKCLGVAASGQAGMWPCTSNADQMWHWGWPKTPGSTWRALTNGNDQCLSVDGGSTDPGAQIIAFTWGRNIARLTRR
jgi:hypothetical protein